MAKLTDTQKNKENGSFVNFVITKNVAIPGVDSFVIFPSN